MIITNKTFVYYFPPSGDGINFEHYFPSRFDLILLTPKFRRSGLPRLHRPVPRLDRLGRPIRSPDERDMASGRSLCHSGGYTGGPGGLTGSRLCKPSWSCILARDLLGFQLQQGQDFPTL
jgi:hypothetical protein